MAFSDRVYQMEASRTARFTPLIAQLRREGREIIDLAVGEPHFATPPQVTAAVQAALAEGRTRYGPVTGLPELRRRLADGLPGRTPENILICNGAKQALYLIFQTLLNPGDEVIVPVPYWTSFPEQIKLAGGTPVFIPTRDHQLDIRDVCRAFTPKTRAVLINSPHNPTGAVYGRAVLEEVSAVVRERGLMIVSDEAYEGFVYDGHTAASFADLTEAREHTVIVKSFSKRWSMTGFRLGFMAAPTGLIQSAAKLQSHISGNVCTFAQWGGLAALALDDLAAAGRHRVLQQNLDTAFEIVSRLFPCIRPQGAFYLFPDVSERLQRNETSENWAARILARAGVAVVPGEAFGAPGHIRISFAVAPDELFDGLERIAAAL